jgi:uncharacterized protein involved in outer membrane biogenesis
MISRRGIKIMVASVFVLLAAGIAVLVFSIATFDPNSLKPRIAEAVRDATGRDLSLAGPIKLRIGLQPTLEVSDATLTNPPGFSRPQFATLKRMDLQLALIPLISNRIEIIRLILVEPDILLESLADGSNNWGFTPRSTAAQDAPTPAAQSPGTPLAFAFETLRIDHGRIGLREAGRAATVLDITRLEATSKTGPTPVHLVAQASFDAIPLTLDATLGPIAGLRRTAPGEAWPFKAKLTLADAAVALDGNATQPSSGEGLAAALDIAIPDPAALGTALHAGLPPLGASTLRARLTRTKTGLELSNIAFASKSADLAGTIALALGARPALSGQLTAKRIDLDALQSAPKPGTGTASAAPARRGERLLPETPLPVDLLPLADADLTLSIAELQLDAITYRAISTRAILNAGTLHANPLGFDMPGGHVDASLSVANAQPAAQIGLTLRAPGLAIAPLLAAYRLPPYASGTLELRAELRGTGTTPHAMAASLSGPVGLAVAGGRLDARRLGGVLGDVLQAADLGQAGNMTDLRCLAVRIDNANGSGALRTLHLESPILAITSPGNGRINWSDETLAVPIVATARVAGTPLNVPLTIQGRLANPGVKGDALDTVTGNGEAAARLALGIATGGASTLLGAIGVNPLDNADASSCAPALAAARLTAAAPAPQPAKSNTPEGLFKQLFR